MARRSVLLIVAVLIALVGTSLIVLYVQGIDARATAGQELVEVLTATDVIDAGEDVAAAQEAGKFEKTEVRREDLVEGALTCTSSITDLVAVGTIYPGRADPRQEVRQPRRRRAPWSSRTTSWPSRSSSPTPSGSPASSTPAPRWRSSCRPIPCSTSRTARSRSSPQYTGLLLPKVEVVGVGTTSIAAKTTKSEEGEETEQVARTILTVAVDQEEAEKLIYADRNGDISFALLTERLRGLRQRRRPRRPTSCPSAFRNVAVTTILEPDVAQLGDPERDAARVDRHDQHGRAQGPPRGEPARVRRRARPVRRRRRRHATSPSGARITRPDLGVILLRHGVDSETPRRWPCAAACARSSRPATSPASPPPCTGRAAWPRRSPRPWRTRPRPPPSAAMAAGRGRAGRGPGRRRRTAGQGHHRLLHQGRRRQEPGRDQPRRRPERRRATGSAWSTSTSTAVTSRSCCSSTPTRTINDLVAFNGEIDDDALATILTTALRPPLARGGTGPPRLPRPRRRDGHRPHDRRRSRRMFDFIVVDTSGVFDDHALDRARPHRHHRAGRHARHPGAQGAQARDRHPRPAQLRPGRRGSSSSTGPTARSASPSDEFESTLGLKADATLVSSREVLAAVNRGEALVSAYPEPPQQQGDRRLRQRPFADAPTADRRARRRSRRPPEEGMT